MYDITYMWNLKKPNSLEIESKMVVTRGGRLGFEVPVGPSIEIAAEVLGEEI